jgi:3-oxoacyl-[acyl-carrier protein] reductase
MDDLSGRVALVTGASRGIGRAIARQLAQAGCDVAVNYRRTEMGARGVWAEIKGMGRRAAAIRADVSDPEEARALVREVEETLGPVGILVNNAGISQLQPLETISVEDWHAVINTNLTSAFLVTQAALPAMRLQGWGRIIMLSSVAAQTGGVIGPHYAASKAGMLGLMHSYATLLAKEGITANAIAPALVETDMIRNNPNIKPEMLPVGRFGTIEEVADAALVLARNGYITGQTINVNGGWYMS